MLACKAKFCCIRNGGYMKKITVIFFTLLLTMLCFVGCQDKQSTGNTEKTEGAKKNSNKIALTLCAEEGDFEMLQGMIDSFKEHYAGEGEFEITLKAQTDAEAKDVILADVHAAGDVFSFPDDQFPGLLSAGVLAPVENADEVKAANVESSVEAATYKDTLYAFPYTADNGFFLYYDKRYFNDNDVKTLEGILRVAKKHKKKFSMELNSGWYMYAFFGRTGLNLSINEDGVTNSCDWNSTENEIKGVDIAQAMLKITSSPAFLMQGDGEFVNSIKSGKVIAGISGTWNATGVVQAWGNDYGAVKLPTYRVAGKDVQMSSFTGYKMMGVNAYSKEKKWAMKLADWLTNEENQTIRFKNKSQGPSNINAAASDEVAKVPAIQAVLDQAQYGDLQRVGIKFWDPCKEFANVIAAGNPHHLKLQALLDKMTKGITSSIAE